MRKSGAILLFTVSAFTTILIAGCPATPGSPCSRDIDCDDRDPCTTGRCDESGLCVIESIDDEGCDDREITNCRTDDDCDRGDPCITSVCIPGGTCVQTPLCIDSICDDGICVECLADADCDDGLFCTTDACDSGACTNTQIDCDDGLFCTGVESCDEVSDGTCISPGDPCAQSASPLCDEELDVCIHIDPFCTENADCDDGNFCTGIETCVDSTCFSSGNPCAPVGPCNTRTCDETLDTCAVPDGVVTSLGLSFTLATDRLTGTSSCDTASAPLLFNAPTGTSKPSFQDGDSFDGREGFDTVNLQFNFDVETTVEGAFISVEKINITDFGTAATTLIASQFLNVEEINVWPGTNSVPLTFRAVPLLIRLKLITTASGVSIEFDAESTAGATDELPLTLEDTEGGTVTLTTSETSGVEKITVESTGDGNTITQLTQVGGTTLTDVDFEGDASLSITDALDDSVTTINATDLTGDLTVTAGGGPVTMIGGSGDDVLTASPLADIINSGAGNDRILPGNGIDLITFGAGSDILDLSTLTAADLTSDNRAHVTDATFDGTTYTGVNEVDAFAFGDVTTVGTLSSGLDDSQLQTATAEGNVVIDAATAVVELAFEFSASADLASATDGTPLLSGLGGTIQTPAPGHRQLLIAYQNGTVFVYYGDSGDDTALTAGEIQLVASASGAVSVGGLDASSFQ
jgi:hypothetical protein